MIFSITVFKALLGQVQLLLCIVQALQLFQAEVAPHNVQLENRVVVHSVQQLFALTRRRKLSMWSPPVVLWSPESSSALAAFVGLTNGAFI